jgi:hypothetical protein
MDIFFRFLGYKFRWQIWKSKDNEIEVLSDESITSTTNFWEEIS